MAVSPTPQKVVLVRHGDAVSKLEDPGRPLSELGREHAESTAVWLAGLRLELDELRHSGKERARQTAEIFARRLGVSDDKIRAVSGSPS